ncbi:MAG: hypothetical protein A3I44_05570 [Candidatus Sungbacteria bacterium RIFCSPLOWO2_02_FULL_51_17]|uniref:Uncharacterized protein n=1 Tax=Candidatus Sungbacteria bacterium RIFCSPHIGHO2_02_FULL_51_29 TaxID=1802273 RepID=A0A1G2KRB8_9BACT|nr:MAG: hypothetical protein A2676_03895 [Candidatus Sungbacteria bacterium RIFCSPHIGHO2_01_FULL_51_22]OHA01976.1 MAG: hypothetical protein A3C16_02450 [Candidatus Sungbacteria bacterium RIFCSPHIGHO2_02_FULL_51_29]OHA06500.1 MAG: hypothetical protein A3B29_02990 [Candidatus Sungbacteria bacterium RIFCSPLOWO2_01_FULL_51_34]OHA11162.1 MAG: hypothetical protein A3I44_05570 [Candidatus Sungbacteria bacterium RIFCSPLOWO2_02_FULL_51_17]
MVTALGCARTMTIIPDIQLLEHNKSLYTPVKTCRSASVDVDILLFGRTQDPARDMWTKDALILITVKKLERVLPQDAQTPLTLAWFHTAERDQKTGTRIERTFTDFPVVIYDPVLEPSAEPKSPEEFQRRMKEQYQKFLLDIVPDRPLDIRTLWRIISEIMPAYSALIESCVYGF